MINEKIASLALSVDKAMELLLKVSRESADTCISLSESISSISKSTQDISESVSSISTISEHRLDYITNEINNMKTRVEELEKSKKTFWQQLWGD